MDLYDNIFLPSKSSCNSGKTFDTVTNSKEISSFIKRKIEDELDTYKFQLRALDNDACMFRLHVYKNKASMCKVLKPCSSKCDTRKCSFYTTEREAKISEIKHRVICKVKGITPMKQMVEHY